MLRKRNIFNALNTYRIARMIPMHTFAADIGLDPGTVRRALFGISKPHDYNMPKFIAYYATHREEIDEAVSRESVLVKTALVGTDRET